jgi:ATP-binding cassette subfamily C (CFTR/MRP) protein 2
MNEMNPKF